MRVGKQFPRQKKTPGVYMFDFTPGRAVPLDMMEKQCESGLKMLRKKCLGSEKRLTERIDTVEYDLVPD